MGRKCLKCKQMLSVYEEDYCIPCEKEIISNRLPEMGKIIEFLKDKGIIFIGKVTIGGLQHVQDLSILHFVLHLSLLARRPISISRAIKNDKMSDKELKYYLKDLCLFAEKKQMEFNLLNASSLGTHTIEILSKAEFEVEKIQVALHMLK